MPETMIKSAVPRREWLVRCTDEDLSNAVCVLEVNRGRIVIWLPGCGDFSLDGGAEIADFRDALDEAIAQADADLRDEEEERKRTGGKGVVVP
ncbi:hypothetical protein [Amycolatopsis samaneae]|uniref:Uncharacterized protein n=1 Tax=Amycolatopsis samaneae TaxID=664691 RepID=A0ABW5G8B8_9PSEU